MEHIWTVICANAIVDKDSNNLSLINVIERIEFQLRPGANPGDKFPIPLTLVSFWTRSSPDVPESGQMRVGVLLPSSDSVTELSSIFDINLIEHLRARFVLNIASTPFDGSGIYKYVVQKSAEDDSWVDVARIPLEIIERTLSTPTEES